MLGANAPDAGENACDCERLRLGRLVEDDDSLREIVERWAELGEELRKAIALIARQGK